MTDEQRKLVRDTVVDLVDDLLYYGREDDEELTEELLDSLFESGQLTKGLVVEWFRAALEAA